MIRKKFNPGPLFFSSIVTVFFACLSAPEAQEGGAALLARFNTGPYKTIERSDWSRYDNGKYLGHVYREVRSTLNPQSADRRGFSYRGNFYVLEETLRDMRQSSQAVDAVIPVSFRIFPTGDFEIDDDRGFPVLRGFPSFPPEPVKPGSRWVAEGVRMADPLNEGYPAAVPIVVEYEYQGVEAYQGIPVHRISAQYAVRFQGPPGGAAPEGSYFKTLQGSHRVDIFLRTADGLPLFMRDNLEETYTWANGSTVRFRGFTLTFGEGTVPLNPGRVIATLNGGGTVPGAGKTIELETGANIAVTTVPGGIKLTVKDIRFAPDSEEFLAAEYPRLDIIARALKEVPDRTFLVEGHTAAVGRPQGEMDLSIRRARRMVNELVKRGIDAGRFLYKGWGGTKPLEDNSTEPGRALNRRVEITILE